MEKSLTILICVRCLSEGGAERVASLWANGFAERGYKVVLVTFRNNQIKYDINPQINHINIDSSKRHLLGQIDVTKKLRGVIKAIKPDIIIPVMHPIGLWVKISARGMGIPVVFTDHNAYEWPKEAQKRLPTFHRFHKLYTNRIFDKVTVLSSADVNYLGEKGKNVIHLPNPLSLQVCDTVPPKKKILFACGRLDGWYVKGFDILINAWGKIANRFPEWRLLIAGEGSNSSNDYLQSIANKYKLGTQISFLGFVDVEPIYKESSIFVLSSRYEGFGMVLIEAMSQGCACIACDWRGRQKEIIPNDDFGLICPPSDIVLLSNSIERLIEDSDLRQLIQKNSLIRAQNYELPKIIDRWEDIFKSVGIQF